MVLGGGTAEAQASCSAESDDISISSRRCYGGQLRGPMSPRARKIFTISPIAQLNHRLPQGMRRRHVFTSPPVWRSKQAYLAQLPILVVCAVHDRHPDPWISRAAPVVSAFWLAAIAISLALGALGNSSISLRLTRFFCVSG